MKVYEVEYRAVVTVVEQDMGKAALQGAALIKDNPHLICVRGVHERNPLGNILGRRTHNEIPSLQH